MQRVLSTGIRCFQGNNFVTFFLLQTVDKRVLLVHTAHFSSGQSQSFLRDFNTGFYVRYSKKEKLLNGRNHFYSPSFVWRARIFDLIQIFLLSLRSISSYRYIFIISLHRYYIYSAFIQLLYCKFPHSFSPYKRQLLFATATSHEYHRDKNVTKICVTYISFHPVVHASGLRDWQLNVSDISPRRGT